MVSSVGLWESLVTARVNCGGVWLPAHSGSCPAAQTQLSVCRCPRCATLPCVSHDGVEFTVTAGGLANWPSPANIS